MASASTGSIPGDAASDDSSVTSAASAVSSVTPSEAEVTRADELKAKGNGFFKTKRFGDAVQAYTEAIQLNPTAVLFGNRAFANLKMENFGLAISDAEKALEMDPTYIKGHYRRGSALLALGKYSDAKVDFLTVAREHPQNRNARAQLAECNKIIKAQAFANAISGGTKMVAGSGNTGGGSEWKAYELPGDYSGPAWDDDNAITVEYVQAAMAHFKAQKMLPKRHVARILADSRRALRALPSLVEVDPPPGSAPGSATPPRFNICGDTHGQYYDLLNIFEVNGMPSEENPYLFNGDFVDRGSFGVENILTLLMWKLAAPGAMHLNRGNHETVNMNKMYGFEGEVRAKLEGKFMDAFTEVFQSLPLVHVVGGKVMVVHGGLPSTDGHTLEEIKDISRFQEPPEGSLFNDLLWTDPQPFQGRGPSKRGLGKSFGPDITAQFLKDNGLSLLVRSHEVRDDGYLVEHDGKCVTVFSAPNYCDEMGNKGGIVHLDSECNPTYTQFTEVPHPPVRPMAYSAGLMSMFGLA